MKLTDLACKQAKPKAQPYKLNDGLGLNLHIQPSGSKLWRLKYAYRGNEKTLSIGCYPLVSLAEAREARDEAKKQLRQGIDPSAAKQASKAQAIRDTQNTFEAVALDWHEARKAGWSPKHGQLVMHKLETDVLPYIGKRPINQIDAPELLEVLRKIEKRGAIDMAHRARQIAGQVFRYGIATGHCQRDVAADLRDALKTRKAEHFATLDIKKIPQFLGVLESNRARLYPRTIRAIRLLMLTFVRTSELIEAKWDEFDLEAGEWQIPAGRMKMGKPHIVPLSSQAVALLRAQKEETGHLGTQMVFPSHVRPRKGMSNNTILHALKAMGYGKQMTGHGFRALAMTTIKEKLGYRHEVIDRQLAHAPRSKVTAAYDRAQFLDDRRQMMQDWADYIDAQSGLNVVAFVTKRGQQ